MLSVYWNIRNFFGKDFFYFFELGPKIAGFHFRKYQKSFLLGKYKNFFNLIMGKFHLLKYQEFFRGEFLFYFPSWGVKVRQTVRKYTTVYVSHINKTVHPFANSSAHECFSYLTFNLSTLCAFVNTWSKSLLFSIHACCLCV